jgi:ribosome-binding factor A
MSHRIEKVNELIKKHLNDIFLKDLSFKEGVFITIARVDTSPDLRYSKVLVSVFPEKETGYALETLRKEMYRIQGALNKKLSMRPLPQVRFELDDTEAKTDEIEKIFQEINQ